MAGETGWTFPCGRGGSSVAGGGGGGGSGSGGGGSMSRVSSQSGPSSSQTSLLSGSSFSSGGSTSSASSTALPLSAIDYPRPHHPFHRLDEGTQPLPPREDKVYSDMAAARMGVEDHALKHGYGVKFKRNAVSCSFAGAPKPTSSEASALGPRAQKTDCSFAASLVQTAAGVKVVVEEASHNHPSDLNIGVSFWSNLTKNEKSDLGDMFSRVRDSHGLPRLPNNKSISNLLYEIKQAPTRKSRASSGPVHLAGNAPAPASSAPSSSSPSSSSQPRFTAIPPAINDDTRSLFEADIDEHVDAVMQGPRAACKQHLSSTSTSPASLDKEVSIRHGLAALAGSAGLQQQRSSRAVAPLARLDVPPQAVALSQTVPAPIEPVAAPLQERDDWAGLRERREESVESEGLWAGRSAHGRRCGATAAGESGDGAAVAVQTGEEGAGLQRSTSHEGHGAPSAAAP